jgi:hypothetical protein
MFEVHLALISPRPIQPGITPAASRLRARARCRSRRSGYTFEALQRSELQNCSLLGCARSERRLMKLRGLFIKGHRVKRGMKVAVRVDDEN